MLLNDLYHISKQEQSPGSVNATLSINKNHKIFEGHFPGQPVLPGVCMMQIVRELMEESTGKKFKIAGVDNMKFLTVIDPEKNNQVDVTITITEQDEGLMVNATLFAGDLTFFKLAKGILKESND